MEILWIVDLLTICLPYLGYEYTLIARTNVCRQRKRLSHELSRKQSKPEMAYGLLMLKTFRHDTT